MMMGMKRLWGCSLAALLITTAACNDQPLSSNGLTADEVDFLIAESDVIFDAILGDVLGSTPATLPAGEPLVSGAGEPKVSEFSFEKSRSCPLGGEVIVSGSGQRIVDDEMGLKEMMVEGEKQINDCAYGRGEMVYTVNGNATTSAHRRRENGQLVMAEHSAEGVMTIATNDGREPITCEFSQQTVYDPETNTWHITGEMCGQAFDKTRGSGGSGSGDR